MKKRNEFDVMKAFAATIAVLLMVAVIVLLTLVLSRKSDPPSDLPTAPNEETTPIVPPEELTTPENTTSEQMNTSDTSDDRSPESDPLVTQSPETTEAPQITTTPNTTSPQVTTKQPETTVAPETTEPPVVTTPPETTPEETTPQIPQNRKLVALTFDDGPNATRTEEVLDVLDKYNVKATFFVLGTNIKGTARENALKMTAERGHEIANHTYSHPTVTKITADELVAEIDKASDRIFEACGVRPTLVRTPGGKWTSETLQKVNYPLIHWTVDTRDWEHNDPQKALEYLKKQVYDGAIILMHDRMSTSAEMTALLIEWLNANDYDIVTVTELMRLKGTELRAGRVYFSATNTRG